MKSLTVTTANSGDFNITVVKTTHYQLSGLRIDFKISDISIFKRFELNRYSIAKKMRD
jgi:hypothetical protein